MTVTTPQSLRSPAPAPTYRSTFQIGQETLGQVGGDASVPGVRWLLKRNCSASPRQVLGFFLVLCGMSLGIAFWFWSQGAAYVLPFALIEVLCVGGALLINARHAGDRESIDLHRGRLTVEQVVGQRVRRVEFESSWVRVEPEEDDRSLIELSGQGRRVSVGRFLRPELRRQLATELRLALRGWSRPGGRGAEPVVSA